MQYKLCHSCWSYWKKYGGLKNPSKLSKYLNFCVCFCVSPKKKLFLIVDCQDDAETETRKKSGSVSDEERTSGGSHRPHQCTVASCGKIFKLKAHLARHYATAHGMMLRAGSPRPIMKTRTAFYLLTPPMTRLARRLCRHLLHARHAARSPFWSINVAALKQECKALLLVQSGQLIDFFSSFRSSTNYWQNGA